MSAGALAGRVALVTGGRGGIGRAVCARLAREGATVYAADLDECGAPDDAPRPLTLDVTDEDSVRAAIDAVSERRLDILVNAAGIEIEKTAEDTSLEEWNRSFAVNVTGTFLASKHALPLMRAAVAARAGAGGGTASIVNFGSYDGFIADPGLAAYCATKGAVHALTRAMACDHGPEGIRVNAVCPGYIDTPMLQSFFNGEGSGGAGRGIGALRQAVRNIHPMRSYGTPEDVAGLVNWLAGDEARYASGQLWVLDGGLTAQVQQMRP
ncbi:MAG: SDR family oxidoreductase [Rhodobacteraceae bacterium]|nr:SDR family oxidoreductase [Paracoccaceae bacterium]